MAKLERNETDLSGADLAARLPAISGGAGIVEHGGSLWISAPQLDVETMAREMKALGYRLITMTGRAREDGETTIIYHYAQRGPICQLHDLYPRRCDPVDYPDIRMASWFEREIHDFLPSSSSAIRT